MMARNVIVMTLGLWLALAAPAAADSVFFSTGNVDGLMGMASRPSVGGLMEKEAADDFVTTATTTKITGGTFTGLLTGRATLSNITGVSVEIYRVFPKDSGIPSGAVPTRANSPSDVAFDSRASGSGLSFNTSTVSSSFTVLNTVVNGINPSPTQTTGGEGAATGTEVQFDFTLTTPLDLPADHYFFVPQVSLSTGDFLWLSAARPIVAPGTPFPSGFTDLQTWIRDDDISPDWLRVGADIVGSGAFNGAFSLNTATNTPEPSTLAMLLGLALCVPIAKRRGRTVDRR